MTDALAPRGKKAPPITPEEGERIRELLTTYRNAPYIEIARIMRRSPYTIKKLAARWGLKRKVCAGGTSPSQHVKVTAQQMACAKLRDAYIAYAERYRCGPMLARIMAYEARAAEVRG